MLVYFWQISLGAEGNHGAVISLGVIPAVLLNKVSLPAELFVIPAGLTVFTSMFLHGGFMHLAGNMLYLWIFGNNVEDSMGYVRFIIFYLLCGVAAVAGQTLQNPDSQIPMRLPVALPTRARTGIYPTGIFFSVNSFTRRLGPGSLVCNTNIKFRFE